MHAQSGGVFDFGAGKDEEAVVLRSAAVGSDRLGRQYFHDPITCRLLVEVISALMRLLLVEVISEILLLWGGG